MFKGLVSPFHSLFQSQTNKCKPQSRQPCNCDDDDEDGGMAPECAFFCTMGIIHKNKSHNASKKRRAVKKHTHTKKNKMNIYKTH